MYKFMLVPKSGEEVRDLLQRNKLGQAIQQAYRRVGAKHVNYVMKRLGLPVASAGKRTKSKAVVSEIKVAGLEAFDVVGEAWLEAGADKPIAVLFGFSPWKREVAAKFFADYRVAFARKNTPWRIQHAGFKKHPPSLIAFWGMQGKKGAVAYAERHSIPIWRIEDGFLRSVGLGAAHIDPLSCAIDKTGIYFDRSRPSDLERLIEGFDASKQGDLLRRADKCMSLIRHYNLTKYNVSQNVKLKELHPSRRRRVLVIGQVESDASIKYGAKVKYSNNDLVRIAHSENEDAEVIYKPHPDVLGGHRDAISDPREVADIATIISGDYDFQELLNAVDHVYTLTSLMGFESVLRGKKVSVFGEPFYAGWGLTDDRHKSERRTAKRTLQEVFAAAYILYPAYCVGSRGAAAELEHAILALVLEKYGTPRALAEQIASHFEHHAIDADLCTRLVDALQKNPYLQNETAFFSEGQSGLLDLLAGPDVDSGKVADYLVQRALEGGDNRGVFWTLRNIAQSDEPSEAIERLKDIAPQNFALEDAADLVSCLTRIGKFDDAEQVLNRKAEILSETVSSSDFLLLLEACEMVRSEQGRFGRKPVDGKPLWHFFDDNLHWLRHDPQFFAVLSKIFDHLSHHRMLEEMHQLSYDLLGSLNADDVLGLAKLSQVIVASLFKPSKRPELIVQPKRQLAVEIYRSAEAKVTSFYQSRSESVPKTVGMQLFQMAMTVDDKRGIGAYKRITLDDTSAVAKGEMSHYKKTVSDYFNMLVRARNYKGARSFLASQKDKIPEEFFLHLLSNCCTYERRYSSAATVARSLLTKYKKNSYRRKLATIYANSGELDKASAWLNHAAAAAAAAGDGPARRESAAIREELARVDFLSQASKILDAVAQPKLPRGVVFLGSFGCLNTISMVVPVLLELKRQGYAVVQLDEGMLRNEPTGIAWIDKHAGMIDRVIHTDRSLFGSLTNEWTINWAGREVIADGINYYQAIFEIMTQKFRAFNFNINDPWIFRWFRYYLVRCDKALTACKSIEREVMKRGMPVRFINAGSHSAPFSVYRSFALEKASKYDVGFIHMGPAYENYYSNLKSKVATTVSLDNLTKHPLYRLPFLARPDRFEEWLKRDGLYERYKEDIDRVLNHNRVGRLEGNTSHTQYEETLIRAKQAGRKVIGVYGKILCDMAVPFDGGPGHENIADWLRHTVATAGSTSNLIVLKPHPHELRPEIARDLNEYWLDLIGDMDIPENVLILPHTGFNNQDLIKYLDLAVLWNGTSSLELCAQGVPVVMASHFGKHDYPIELIYPESRSDYERIICADEWERPDRQKMERAALLLKYMGTEEVCVPFTYSHRPVTNDPVGVPFWHMDEVEKFLRDGDPHISRLADKFFA
ncbi:beta-3-deoxy-D-manno-oct-2-ulosonic acid transferase [Sinorhizobium sp. CCBAU 05631]|uniref:capsular polysaccharide export protein, LipB/KpsS family n=1 Tax=Sinorhizobium sp. CCBAU 05631 TaxID=794846 RepID=UPI0004B98013|nr:beta-3-deoxy-D-manno-oct-2-ulosonic acid transferase [Sinorhizobium sp. CCBAU 05631]